MFKLQELQDEVFKILCIVPPIGIEITVIAVLAVVPAIVILVLSVGIVVGLIEILTKV